jgi:hypothetical protein
MSRPTIREFLGQPDIKKLAMKVAHEQAMQETAELLWKLEQEKKIKP